MSVSKSNGGLKGIIQKTGRVFYAGGMYAKESGMDLLKKAYVYGGNVSFFLATTSMLVLMPLMFEIAREAQVSLETSR
jgi:hypothetical protein